MPRRPRKSHAVFMLSALMLLASGLLLADWVRGEHEQANSHFPPFIAEKILNTRTESACSLSADCGSGDTYSIYLVLPGRTSPDRHSLDIWSILSHTRVAVRDADSQALLGYIPETVPVDHWEESGDRMRWSHDAVLLRGFGTPMATKRMTITCTIDQGIRWPDTITIALGSMQTDKGWYTQRSLWLHVRHLYKYPIVGLAIGALVTFVFALRTRRASK